MGLVPQGDKQNTTTILEISPVLWTLFHSSAKEPGRHCEVELEEHRKRLTPEEGSHHQTQPETPELTAVNTHTTFSMLWAPVQTGFPLVINAEKKKDRSSVSWRPSQGRALRNISKEKSKESGVETNLSLMMCLSQTIWMALLSILKRCEQ